VVIRTLVEAVLNSYIILSLSYYFMSPCIKEQVNFFSSIY